MHTMDLDVQPITAATFAPFGRLIEPEEDGTPFDPSEGLLDFGGGQPRFYIMRLPARSLIVGHITRHRAVTQCLAAAGGGAWLLAVAPPDDPSPAPRLAAIRAFLIKGTCAVHLHRGTWHAGPFVTGGASTDFFNLELDDTNVVDHQTCDLAATYGVHLRLGQTA
jgi:ureidoglycolate lyase